MDGRIMRRSIISSCQSAATSEIVKRCCSSLCKQRYSKYSDLYLYLLHAPWFSDHPWQTPPPPPLSAWFAHCISVSLFIYKLITGGRGARAPLPSPPPLPPRATGLGTGTKAPLNTLNAWLLPAALEGGGRLSGMVTKPGVTCPEGIFPGRGTCPGGDCPDTCNITVSKFLYL